MVDDFEKALDPELVAVFRQLPALDYPELDARGVQQRRLLLIDAMRDRFPSPVADPAVAMDDLYIGDGDTPLRVRLYRPRKSHRTTPLPALLWIHGGGFILGNIESEDTLCQQLCKQADCLVASVEYRLAPQHPYPAAADDCYRGLTWLTQSSHELTIDPNRIAVGGSSAGGCLAAAVALRARDEKGPRLAMQILVIPALDDRCETVSSRAVTDPRVWNRSLSQKTWAAYLAEVTGEVPCYAAPARADNLAGLPPAFVSIAELDLLRDEAMSYAQRLMHSGVQTELHVYPGTFHGWFMFAPQATASIRHQRDIVHALTRKFT
jgi:acetyl esterase/lipase